MKEYKITFSDFIEEKIKLLAIKKGTSEEEIIKDGMFVYILQF